MNAKETRRYESLRREILEHITELSKGAARTVRPFSAADPTRYSARMPSRRTRPVVKQAALRKTALRKTALRKPALRKAALPKTVRPKTGLPKTARPKTVRRRPSHVADGPRGPEARMVDVGAKAVTRREAEARAVVVFPRGVRRVVLSGRGPKGPVLEVARTAAVLAAKRTDSIVPLCHSIPLDSVVVEFTPRGANELEIRVRAACTGRTGVEMEALVGASVAALTVYDMSKAVDHGIRIERVELLEKSGGRSGTWRALREKRSSPKR